MNTTKIIVSVLLTLLKCSGWSQNFELVENKGQWHNAVRFEGNLLCGAFFLEPHGYKIVQHNPTDLQRVTETLHGGSEKGSTINPENNPLTLRSHAYEVLFDKCNAEPVIVPENPQVGYNNYFIGNDPLKWASNCKIYGSATYKEMYPGIDVHYYSDKGYLKYDIIINPKADISKLALTYEGIETMEVRDGDLFIKTSVGEIKEQAPYSYQIVNGILKQVDCQFQVEGKTLRYQLGSYDQNYTLIIDPTLVFSSFTGSTKDNWGYTATHGPGGIVYGAGIVFGTGFPVSTGAFQTTFGGGTNTGESTAGYDLGIIKLSSDGTQRLYATYVGGNGNEAPQSMITDAQGNLVLEGRTNSNNFPVTRAAIGTGANGNDWDIFVLKLNPGGSSLVGSIRIGGSNDDGVNIRNKYPNPVPQSLMQNYNDDTRSDLAIDASGNIWVASCTQSSNFPVIAGTAFQAAKSGLQDALLLKFDANLTNQTYGSFLGGSGDDAGYTMGISPQTGDIWIGGGTNSPNFPGNKSGTIGSNSGGGIDGFLAVVSPTGVLLKSTYIATAGNEQVYGFNFDKNGFPYIMGTTTGSFSVLNAAFSQAGGKQFIAKIQKDLSSYVYATVFGTNATAPNIVPVAFMVDNCENVYVSGWGGSITSSSFPQFPNAGTTGLTVTPNALQLTTDGKDFYFFVLEKNAASQLYGSFFGQNGSTTDHLDGGSCRFDEDGVLYQAVCANCGATASFPTTPGSWSTTNTSGGGCNQALVKIKFDLAGVRAGLKSSIGLHDGDTSDCAIPLTVDFRDTVAMGITYEWDFGDGTGTVTTAFPTFSHTYTSTGNFRARLIAVDNSKCISRDTAYVNIKAGTFPNFGADTIVYQNCPGYTTNLLQLYNTTGFTASWNTATPSEVSPGNYQLTGINAVGCADTAFATIVLEVARWIGAIDDNWHNAANWNINKVPDAKTHVIVPGGTDYECIVSNADAQAASVQLRNGGTVRAINNTQIFINGICVALPL